MPTESQMLQVMAGFAVLAGLLFAGSGSYLLYTSVKKYRTSARRDAFKAAEARVLGAELTIKSGESTSYIPEIEYQYTVAGETYTSESVYPGTDFNIKNKDFAEELVERYSEGEVVEAFYDPEDPTNAFLENESVATRSIVFAIISVPFVLVGLGLIIGGTLWIL